MLYIKKRSQEQVQIQEQVQEQVQKQNKLNIAFVLELDF